MVQGMVPFVQPTSSDTAPRPPMDGKVVLVTGATNGIGMATACELARRGATVVGVGRSAAKCAAVERELRAVSGNPSFEMIVADLSTRAGVRCAAETFRAGHRRLDALINNAGAFFYTRQESADGIEMTWALNHLGYFHLTHLLLDLLQASAPSRVVTVSSGAHYRARIHFDDVELHRGYNGWRAYCQSKLANVLFSNELARRLAGAGVTSNALHPGWVGTGIGRTGGLLLGPLLGLVQRATAVTPEEGARTSVYLASSPDVEGVTGKYWSGCRPATPNPAALDEANARRLWALSESMLNRNKQL